MKRDNYTIILLFVCLLTATASAEDERTPNISGGITITAQMPSDNKVDNETQASADLVGVLPIGPGEFNIHIEGSTTPGTNGVAALLEETNGDVGSALDRDGDGRIQISELFYSLPVGPASLGIGLLDPSANIDTNAVANDENTQFLAGSLINAPTIAFPDYTLGITLDGEPEEAGIGYHLFIGSSHGLGDNVERKYGELFELDADGKGWFTAAEGVWKTPDLTARVGVWLNTSNHIHLDNANRNSHNQGLYGGLNGALGAGTWGIRASIADSTVSEASWSLSGAAEYPISSTIIAGFGVAHTAASSKLNANDTLVAEAYMRFTLHEHLQVSPLLQYVHNPGFGLIANTAEEALDANQWLLGVRLHAPF